MLNPGPAPRTGPAADPSGLSRRSLLANAGTVGVAAALGAGCAAQSRPQSAAEASMENEPPIEGALSVRFRVNGKDMDLKLDPRTTLLDCLRESMQLTGTKKGCDHGQCGACTVHINGRR